MISLWRARRLIRRASRLRIQSNATPDRDAALALLDQAERCLDEARALIDRVRWLGMSRTGWLMLQTTTGLTNAWCMVNNIAAHKWEWAVVSACCTFVTAYWRLPPKGK